MHFGCFYFVHQLITRCKTPGSEQVDPQVDSFLGNLSESNHSLLVSTHSPSFLNLTPSGTNRSTPGPTQLWGSLVESTHSCPASTHFQSSFDSFRHGSGQVDSQVDSTLGKRFLSRLIACLAGFLNY